MSTFYEIPLSSKPQTFGIVLSGVGYRMTVRWNAVSQNWLLDIADTTDAPLISGIPLVAGANLLEQFEYVDIGGGLYATTDGNLDTPPTFDNLGDLGHLYFHTA